MIEWLKQVDTQLLLFFNGHNNVVLDFIFYWASDKWIWIPFYAFLAFVLNRQERKKFLILILFIAAAITVSDQISSAVIKEHVQRLRPCHDPEISDQVHLVNGYCGGSFGFVSSHAANVFALATLFFSVAGRQHKKLMIVIWVWASVVAFSRIYLGAHYPGDIIGGALVGCISGSIFGQLYSNKFSLRNQNRILK